MEEFASFELLSSAVIPCACHLLTMAELSRNYFLISYLLDHSWIWEQLMLLQLAGSSSHSSSSNFLLVTGVTETGLGEELIS